jgi:protein O-mannosyl-transferase
LRSWLGNNSLYHPLFVPVLLVSVVLAVYYPAMLSGTHPIDDPGIFSLYSASPPLSQSLLPGTSYYYRPLVELSFWLDNLFWGMEPRVMHLESILLHCANSLLVFLLACKLSDTTRTRLIPLLAALLFALHPVNVEAVAWIAGRTDPLLALFVLSASFFWLRWLDTARWQDMTAAVVLFGVALLAKETALAFGAVLVLLAVTIPGVTTVRQRLTAVGILSGPALLLVLYALIFRSGSSGLSRFLSSANPHPAQAMWEALIAFGFYVKKLIIPFPLNFAIYEVQPLYGLAGVALFLFVWWVMRQQRLAGVLFLSAALFILPAVLVAVKQVAWTLFAERYLYLPTAFFMVGVSVVISDYWDRQKKILLPVAVCMVTLYAGISFQRATLWADKLAFFQDAVAQSPRFGSVYYSLGGLLFQSGKIEQAAEAFAAADRLNQRDSMRYPIKAAIMGALIAKGENRKARDFFFTLFRQKKDAPAGFLELLYKADGKRINSLPAEAKQRLSEDLIETLDLLNQKQPDPFWLYQSGQFAVQAGDKNRAADFFRRAYTAAPPDAHYRGAAKTLFLRLEGSR